MHKVLRGALACSILMIMGCSDSGDSPTEPDPPVALPTIVVSGQTVTEGNSSTFMVMLSAATDSNVIFQYSTGDGTATSGEDYAAVPPTVDTIIPGATSLSVIVATIDDNELDSAESFSLILTDLTGATFADSVGVVTITDNDGVSYVGGVKPILAATCATALICHGTGGSAGGLFIGTAQYASVINATGSNTGGRVIVPGDAAASTLYTKTTESPPFPSRMPQNGPPFLTPDQQERIRDWIDQGALDN